MALRSVLSAALAASLIASAATAQETESAPGLSVELNATSEASGGCTLSFLITNGLSEEISSAVYETVLFDTQGQVDRLTLFDFGTLPADRPRVRQFTLPDTSCGDIGRILVNGANTCEAGSLGETACMENLSLSSRTEIEVVG